jgi:hypothetical protein
MSALVGKPLHLYRALLRGARGMPTKHRRAFVEKRARQAFEEARNETDPEKLR